MSCKKRISIVVICFLIAWNFPAFLQKAYAETKQKEIITLEAPKDLAVMFLFDKEVVDIEFISPSGNKKLSSDSDVNYISGDLWSTYRISNAEAGTWKVEYDLKTNSAIEYSVIEDNYGLWIQYFHINKAAEDNIKAVFEADCETEVIHYNYEIYAVNTDDNNLIYKLSDGRAESNKENETEIKLNSLPSGNYVFRLDVFYRDGGAELFDSIISDCFDYTNPNEPEAIEDFKVYLDMQNLTCEVDWDEYAGGYAAYKLVVYQDEEMIYNGELEGDVKSSGAVFREGAKKLRILLYYNKNGFWSPAKIKDIDLADEVLRLNSVDVTGSGQAVIEYIVKSERLLKVVLNDEEGNYRLSDSGSLFLDLKEGLNSVYAEMECDNLIYFIIDSEVYYDIYPPEIKLYESLDGKTFYTDEMHLLGAVSGGSKFTINGKDITLGSHGEFDAVISLNFGENLVELEAVDINGNSSKMVLTLYKAAKLFGKDGSKSGLMYFLPLIVSTAVSMLIILLAVLFMRKKDKSKTNRKNRLWMWILWDIIVLAAESGCVWWFIKRYMYINSINYLELVEKSAAEAAAYLKFEKILGIAAIAGLLILVLSILITVLKLRKRTKIVNGIEENTVLFCEQCGKEVQKDLKFCTNCGAKIKKKRKN